jgi:hypothetical protein
MRIVALDPIVEESPPDASLTSFSQLNVDVTLTSIGSPGL